MQVGLDVAIERDVGPVVAEQVQLDLVVARARQVEVIQVTAVGRHQCRVGDLPDSGLIATRLGAVRRLTCASLAYLASRPAPVVPQDLADHDVISFESVSTPTTWRYWSDGNELAVTLRSRLGVNTIDAAIDASLAGAGVVRAVSYQVADYVRGGRLQLLLEAYEPVPPPVHLVYDKQNRLPLKLRAFVDYAVPRLRDRLILTCSRTAPTFASSRSCSVMPSSTTPRSTPAWPPRSCAP